MTGDRLEAEIGAEFDAHVELATFHAERAGLKPGEARRSAEQRFGDRTRLLHEVQDVHRSPAVLWAMRLVHTLAVAIPLAILFASTGLVAGLHVRTPRSFHGEGQWVSVWQFNSSQPEQPTTLSTAVEYKQLLARDDVFTTVTAARYESRVVAGPVSGRLARIKRVTPDYLHDIGVAPFLGSDVPGYDPARPVVLLSHRVWSEWFEADTNIIGKGLEVDRVEHTIFGVLPPHVSFYYETELVAPLSLTEETTITRRRLLVGGRLRSDVNIREANAKLDAGVPGAPMVKASSAAFGVPFKNRAYALLFVSVVLSVWALNAAIRFRRPNVMVFQRCVRWPIGPGMLAGLFGGHYLTSSSALAVAGDTAQVFDVSISLWTVMASVLLIVVVVMSLHLVDRLIHTSPAGRIRWTPPSASWITVQLAVGALVVAMATTYAIESINSRPSLPTAGRDPLYVTALAGGAADLEPITNANTEKWALSRAIPGLDHRTIGEVESTSGGMPVRVGVNTVSSEFFDVAGIALESGSTFRPDARGAPSVIVDRSLALSVFGRADIVGDSLKMGQSEVPARIVGVARPIRYGANNLPTLYLQAVGRSDASFIVSRSSTPAAIPSVAPMGKPLLAAGLVEKAARRFNATAFLMVCIGVGQLVLLSRTVFWWSRRHMTDHARNHTVRRFFGATSTQVTMVAVTQVMRPLILGTVIATLGGWLLAPEVSVNEFTNLLIGLGIALLVVVVTATPALVRFARQRESSWVGMFQPAAGPEP